MVAALVLLAAAIAYYGASQRYETVQFGRFVTTTDRLTGHVTLCRIGTTRLECGPLGSDSSGLNPSAESAR